MTGKSIDAGALAQRVKDSRLRLRLNQTDLAHAAGVSQASVSRIETGDRNVTLVEADRLAHALGMPLDTMLHGSKVAKRIQVALRIDEKEQERYTAIASGVELLELDERLDAVLDQHRQQLVAAPVAPPTTGAMATRGTHLAEELRQALSLGTGPIADLIELVEEVTGVDVATRPLTGVSGMCLLDSERDTQLLVVNSNENAERQRFTLAHELGHLLFGDGAHIDLLENVDTEQERRCNEFARNFLVPVNGVTAWLRRRLGDATAPVDEQTLSLLARHFRVSADAVKIQLERMGLRKAGPVPTTPALASRYGWRPEYEAAQTLARRQRPPRRLVQRATAAYAQGLIGAAVLAALENRPVEDIEAERALLTAPAPADAITPVKHASIDELLALADAQPARQ